MEELEESKENQRGQVLSFPHEFTGNYGDSLPIPHRNYGKRIKTVKANGEFEYALYTLSGTLFYVDRPNVDKSTVHLQMGGKPVVDITLDEGSPSSILYLHTDLLGSPRLSTNSSGTTVYSEHYAPYGEKLNNVNFRIGYTGHVNDFDTGLVYAQARFYDPVVGRFLSIDPIGFTDDAFTFNRYGYANNIPYRFTDPSGEMAAATLIVPAARLLIPPAARIIAPAPIALAPLAVLLIADPGLAVQSLINLAVGSDSVAPDSGSGSAGDTSGVDSAGPDNAQAQVILRIRIRSPRAGNGGERTKSQVVVRAPFITLKPANRCMTTGRTPLARIPIGHIQIRKASVGITMAPAGDLSHRRKTRDMINDL